MARRVDESRKDGREHLYRRPWLYRAGTGLERRNPGVHQAVVAVIVESTRLYKAGVPVDQAITQANWGEYGSWTLASSQGPIAIRKVYEELSGRLP